MGISRNLISALIISVLFFFSCSYTNNDIPTNVGFKKEPFDLEEIDLTNDSKLDSFISKIERELVEAKTHDKIQDKTWNNIHRILIVYKDLLNFSGENKIEIPSQTRITYNVNSFCLDVNKSEPADDELFEWIKENSKIPYYREVLNFYSFNKNVDSNEIQELLWNLSNRTYVENYPKKLKKILKRIDQNYQKKLPSKVNQKIISTGISIFERATGIDTNDFKQIIQGQYYSYEHLRANLESISLLNKKMDDSRKETHPSKIPSLELFVSTKSNGFSKQLLSVENPSSKSQIIDFSNYYLKSRRETIQRIAVTSVHLNNIPNKKKINDFFKKVLAEFGILYPNLNLQEQNLIEQYPYESVLVAWYTRRSAVAMNQLFDDGFIDGEADAFRHFIWAGFLLKNLGKNLAEKFLTAHESSDHISSISRQMDEFNNKQGMAAASRLINKNEFSDKALFEEAIKKLKNKRLRVLNPTGIIPNDADYGTF